ncbi:MAG TPA: 50S ribosomal protein L18, partial [Thermoprotei archaeon]|nr:50S ribosomal protein L18 [Thermoprotei archaeon]
VRRSLRYIYVSLSKPKIGGDETLLTVSSKILLKYGFYGLKNLSAAYLTGYIAGRLALKKGVEEAIINLGYAWTKRASIPFAAAMGAREAGLNIPLGKEKYVDMSRLRGEHIANYAKYLKEQNIDLYNRKFSKYIELGIFPENLPELFDKVFNEIKKDYGGESNGE